MKIVLTVKDNGYITCIIYKNNTIKYDTYSNNKDKINSIFKDSKVVNVSERNGITVSFDDGLNEVVIENTVNCRKGSSLSELVQKTKNKYKKIKNEHLRKFKVTRIKTFSTVILLSLTVGYSYGMSKKTMDNNLDIKNIDNNSSIFSLSDDYDISNSELVYNEALNNNEQYNDVLNNYDDEKKAFNLDYSDRTNNTKFINAKNNYNNIITSIANEYGIDPQIMLAIATQESGIHNINVKGPAMGLMQIELSVWDGKSITAYNHSKKSMETIHITKEKLKDLEFNIRTGCMIFQKCLEDSNYNLEVAIQMYNYGYGNILKVFKMYYQDNVSLKDAVNSYDDGWLDYRENIKVGDKEYLEHVMSYVENPDEIKIIDTYCFNKNSKML